MITSDQIHEKEFTRKMRGYNEAEVDEYLDQLAAYIDNLSKENRELRERLKSTADQLAYMKNLETTLRDTLITAQRSAEETTRNATYRAESIIETANDQARQIVNKANEDAVAARRQLDTLYQQAAIYRNNFKMLLDAQLRLMEDSGLGKENYAKGEEEPTLRTPNLRRAGVLMDEPLTAARRSVDKPSAQEEET